MSVVENAMRELMAAGVEGEALIAAVSRIAEAAAAERDKGIAEIVAAISEKLDSRLPPYDQAEHKRALGRARQARYAETKRQRASESVSEASALTQDDAKEIPPTPPKENIPSPPLKGGISPASAPSAPPEKPSSTLFGSAGDDRTLPQGGRRKPARTIPEGFPTEDLRRAERDKAAATGVDLDTEREAEKFRNHAQQTDRRCADWTAAWRNWALKAREWSPTLVTVRPAAPEPDPWPRRMTNWRVNGYWDSEWGPKPGREGCRVPPELLAAEPQPREVRGAA